MCKRTNMRLCLTPSLASMFVVMLFIVALLSGTYTHACPGGCACFITDQVICNLAELSAIPDDIPSSTKYLVLNENHILHIPSDAFKRIHQLKVIRLDDNNITDISKYAFRGLSNMDEIAIQKNPLKKLPSYSFSGLDNVIRIYLGYNKIESVESNAFHGSRNVREVSLIGNPIMVLQSNAFSGFVNVQYFYFPKDISRISPDTFNGLKNVSMLRLERLNSSALEKFAFRGLDLVAGLEIRNSKIGTLEPGAFDGLSNVNYFGIEDSSLDHVSKGAFFGMKNVSKLTISRNTFTDFEDGGFVGLEKLNAKRFSFFDNRLPCDCTLIHISSSLRHLKVDFLSNNWCQSPDDMAGQALAQIQLDQMESCSTMASLTNNVVGKSENALILDVSEQQLANCSPRRNPLDFFFFLSSVFAIMMVCSRYY